MPFVSFISKKQQKDATKTTTKPNPQLSCYSKDEQRNLFCKWNRVKCEIWNINQNFLLLCFNLFDSEIEQHYRQTPEIGHIKWLRKTNIILFKNIFLYPAEEETGVSLDFWDCWKIKRVFVMTLAGSLRIPGGIPSGPLDM